MADQNNTISDQSPLKGPDPLFYEVAILKEEKCKETYQYLRKKQCPDIDPLAVDWNSSICENPPLTRQTTGWTREVPIYYIDDGILYRCKDKSRTEPFDAPKSWIAVRRDDGTIDWFEFISRE